MCERIVRILWTLYERDIIDQWRSQYEGVKKDPVEIVMGEGNTAPMLIFLQTLPADCKITIASTDDVWEMWQLGKPTSPLQGRARLIRDLRLLNSDCDVLYLEDINEEGVPEHFKGKVLSSITVRRRRQFM